ncbi:MAG: hypothetical protein CVU53_04750 [Deltaproteobacteria bacterium HGW-Deltaproteobacteria-11]|nr:MAG: hypothetical protein CVU53_04750 [Deltaproteobacteria bacterium HGW-Deltaproteobacteria-11]
MKKIMFAIIVLVLAVIVLIPIGCRSINSSYTYDILIKGGLVYDGSTAKPVVEDVGIKGDKIAAVGKDLTGSARRTIDVQGLIVTPGFIDVHNHTDLGILMAFIMSGKTGDLSMITPAWKDNHNYATQGVTTIVTGLCGGGFWDTKQWLGLIASQKFNCNVYHLIPW